MISSEREWRAFEAEKWESAIQDRGLQLNSLDHDQRKALVDRLWAALASRLECGQSLADHLVFVARGMTMASFLVAAYGVGQVHGLLF